MQIRRIKEVLTKRECEDTVRRILLMKNKWTEQYGNFYFLGRPYYSLMPSYEVGKYHIEALAQNALLEAFPTIRETLVLCFMNALEAWDLPMLGCVPRSKMQKQWGEAGELWVDFGFNIANKDWTNGGGWHVDTDSLPPEYHLNPDIKYFTVVLYLEVPKSGGGTLIHLHDHKPCSISRKRSFEPDEDNCLLIEPEVGSAVVFSANAMHKIMPMTVDKRHPRRIVAITHFLQVDGHYEYWW